MRSPPDENYITLQEASRLTPYDSNYLGLLIRKGYLFAVKKGGRWYTTREAVEEYVRARRREASRREEGSMFTGKFLGWFSFATVILFVGLIFGAASSETLSGSTQKETAAVSQAVGDNYTVVDKKTEGSVFSVAKDDAVKPGAESTATPKLSQ